MSRHFHPNPRTLLVARGGLLRVGPRFPWAEINADADVIAGGLLVELKVQRGRERSDGTRRCMLERRTVHELLGYLLLDYDNSYGVDALGVYSARYGDLAIWPVAKLLEQLAGGPIDVAAARAEFRAVVQATADARPKRDQGRRRRQLPRHRQP
jgi:hypothetical protein